MAMCKENIAAVHNQRTAYLTLAVRGNLPSLPEKAGTAGGEGGVLTAPRRHSADTSRRRRRCLSHAAVRARPLQGGREGEA